MLYWNKFGLIVLIGFFFFLGTNSTKVTAKIDLRVEGNVLGYDIPFARPTSSFIFPTYPLLVKVSKILQGKEKSKYIIIRLRGTIKDYGIENFGVDKTLTFKLEREADCDETIEDLMTFKEINESGKIVEKKQNLILVSGVEKESLPLKKIIPCYLLP